MKWFIQSNQYLAFSQANFLAENGAEKHSSINNNDNIQVIKRANMKINLIPNLMAMHC